MRIVSVNKDQWLLQGVSCFDLGRTLDCGQCFRWRFCPDGFWEGVASGHFCRIRQEKQGILFTHTTKEQIRGFWIPYFSLDRDYESLCQTFSLDSVLGQAIAFSPGIRLLRQEPWEALCTFILSQNNNIPRIKGIVERLCLSFGEVSDFPLPAFPTPQRLASCSLQDLDALRSGFRAKYLLDAAQKVASGLVDLAAITKMDALGGREALMAIHGVGPKVADCVLLYGYGKNEVIPMDVWMKRVLAQLYPQGFPAQLEEDFGIAQQYLFHYARHHKQDFEHEKAPD